MKKYMTFAETASQTRLSDGIFDLRLFAPDIAENAVPGQFVSLYCNTADRLLPRPVSICGLDREKGILRLVYRIAGEGTKEFSALRPLDKVKILGPLGNGFPLLGEAPVFVGGGIGIPPMLALSAAFLGKGTAVLGYRNDCFLSDEFEKICRTYIATEDGSRGTEGTVLDAMEAEEIEGDVIYACGPRPMLKAVKDFAGTRGIPCYVSMEERMACGIGACLACVCRTVETDPHSNVKNKRICKDGPVFPAEEVEL